jgi:hypothetical protein
VVVLEEPAEAFPARDLTGREPEDGWPVGIGERDVPFRLMRPFSVVMGDELRHQVGARCRSLRVRPGPNDRGWRGIPVARLVGVAAVLPMGRVGGREGTGVSPSRGVLTGRSAVPSLGKVTRGLTGMRECESSRSVTIAQRTRSEPNPG